MEKSFEISAIDNYLIYGTLNYTNHSDKKLVIFVHGLTGNQCEHQYFNAVSVFTKAGFHTFRFDFYSKEPKSRRLIESSIATHIQDLRTVIDHLKKDYEEIILIGHSLGGLVILKSDLSDISRIVLWDPTSGFGKIEDKKGKYSPELDKYILEWRMDIIIRKKMVEEWQRITTEELVENITIPCQFIFAGEYNKHEIWKPFLDGANIEREIAVIPGATHRFTEEGTTEKLHKKTLSFLKRV